MAPIASATKPATRALPRVLMVEDEPALVELVRDVVGPQIECQLVFASDLLPKPFSVSHLVDRVSKALEKQRLTARNGKRLDRLRDAVRRLNVSRRTVSKKVDLLCNDLVGAYGELAKQLDSVRHQESFRKLLAEAKDLEQML